MKDPHLSHSVFSTNADFFLASLDLFQSFLFFFAFLAFLFRGALDLDRVLRGVNHF